MSVLWQIAIQQLEKNVTFLCVSKQTAFGKLAPYNVIFAGRQLRPEYEIVTINKLLTF